MDTLGHLEANEKRKEMRKRMLLEVKISDKAMKIVNRRYTAGMENDFETLRSELMRVSALLRELGEE